MPTLISSTTARQDWHTSAVNHPGTRIRMIVLSCLHNNITTNTLSQNLLDKNTTTIIT